MLLDENARKAEGGHDFYMVRGPQRCWQLQRCAAGGGFVLLCEPPLRWLGVQAAARPSVCTPRGMPLRGLRPACRRETPYAATSRAQLNGVVTSPDQKLLAWSEDTEGGEKYTVHVKVRPAVLYCSTPQLP